MGRTLPGLPDALDPDSLPRQVLKSLFHLGFGREPNWQTVIGSYYDSAAQHRVVRNPLAAAPQGAAAGGGSPTRVRVYPSLLARLVRWRSSRSCRLCSYASALSSSKASPYLSRW